MADVGAETASMSPESHPRLVDRAIAKLAGRQHAVVALWQLKDLGLSARAVRDRVASGRLHRIHRGVYAVGHPILTQRGWFMAAVFACGPGAVLSHRSAALLHRLVSTTLVEVTIPHGRSCRRAGIKVHRSRTLVATDITTVDGIPCTTVARTLVDLAEVLPPDRQRNAVNEAETLDLYDDVRVRAALTANRGRHGAPALAALIDSYEAGTGRTRSELEVVALAAFAAAGLPGPLKNSRVKAGDEWFEVDFLWPDVGLVIEADSRRYHQTRHAFEEDRRRDRRLRLAGYEPFRITWRDVELAPAAVGAEIAALYEAVRSSRISDSIRGGPSASTQVTRPGK
jgi:very-short-patch-repair endonuclease